MKVKRSIAPEGKKYLWTKIAWGIILFFAILSLLAPLLANEKPIFIHNGNRGYWPMFSNVNWELLCRDKSCKKITALIPFSPGTIDVTAIHAAPGAMRKTEAGGRHLLGADQLGRDVLAALIHGSRTAVWVSMLAALLAFIVGLIYGLGVGYYGNDKIRYSNKQLLGLLGLFLFGFFFWVFIWNAQNSLLISKPVSTFFYGLLVVFFVASMKYLIPLLSDKNRNYLDVDTLGMRFVDLIKALPPLFIILFALQLHEAQSMWYMIVLISFLLWAGFARHSRAEVLRLRKSEAVQNATLTWRSDFWVWRHSILPFMIRPLLVITAFSMASAILIEATLSFLGLGLPVEHVSWGTLIESARRHSSSWWLLVFPGLCMLSLIWALQHLGRMLENRLRNRQSLRSL